MNNDYNTFVPLSAHVEREQPGLSAGLWRSRYARVGEEFSNRISRKTSKREVLEAVRGVINQNAFLPAQVMQFGRIDGNAYTLDFQYPFSALQAFSVALANVTQRLK